MNTTHQNPQAGPSSWRRGLLAALLVAGLTTLGSLTGAGAASADTGASFAGCPQLDEGDTGPCITQLQHKLTKVHPEYNLPSDSETFGPATRIALLDFQGRNRLGADGRFGTTTARELDRQYDAANRGSGGAVASPPSKPTETTPDAGSSLPNCPQLDIGDTGPCVTQLQQLLNKVHPEYDLPPDSASYGPKTQAAVRDFQRRNHITGGSGQFGPGTAKALQSQAAKGGTSPSQGEAESGGNVPASSTGREDQPDSTTDQPQAPALNGTTDAVTKTREAPGHGAKAECTVLKNLTEIGCEVADTRADSHSVFIEWQIDGSTHRWDNDNGSNPANTKKSFKEGGLNKKGSAKYIMWRVCVDVQRRGDQCSAPEILNSTEVQAEQQKIQIVCAGKNLNSPPSASIPPDLQPTFNCYQPGADPHFSEGDKCMVAVAEALAGVSWEGYGAKELLKSGGKFWLKKAGPVGLALTGYGVSKTISECSL